MTPPHIVDPATVLSQALGDASPDLMRTLTDTKEAPHTLELSA